MKELLFINIGGAGTRMGDQTWQLLSKEHQVDHSGTSKCESLIYNNKTIFNELPDGRHTPRNLFIDTSPQVVDQVRVGPRKAMYNPSNSITGKEDASNNYIRGHYTIGKEIADLCEDKFAKMLEGCNHLNAVIVNCSMSGGTGSGVTNLLLDRIVSNNSLHKKPIWINMTLPSPRMSDTIVEPYNFIMGLGDLYNLDAEKFIVGYDNEQLYKVSEHEGVQEAGYNQINQLIGKSIVTLTSQSRLNECSSVSELATNVMPYSKAIMLSSTITHTNDIAKVDATVKSLLHPMSTLNSYRNLGNQTILSTYSLLRGELSHFQGISTLRSAMKDIKICDWNPTNLKLKTNSLKLKQSYSDSILQGAMLINSDSCRHLLNKQHLKYDLLYEKRSFIHWYAGEGIDDDSIRQGRQYTAILQKDYEEFAIQYCPCQEEFYYQ